MKASSITIIGHTTMTASIILAIICTAIWSPAAIAYGQSSTPDADFLKYHNADYGINIQYPSDWLVVEGEGLVVSFYVSDSTDSIENVNIGTEVVPSSMDLDEYVEASLDGLEQYLNDFNLLESKSVIVAGMQGHQIVYTTTVPESQFQLMQTFTLSQGTGYIITYVAESANYNTYLPTVKTMISSFQIGDYEEEVEFLDFEDSVNGISLTYPSNWDVTEMGGGQLMFSSPSNDALILITFEDSIMEEVSLEGFTKTHIERMDKDVTFFRIQSESEGVLAGKPAHKIVYTGAQQLFGSELTELKGMQIWTVIEGRSYLFTYAALSDSYSRHLSTAEQMVSSLKIAPTNIPKKISGEYLDEGLGMKLDLPESWSGISTKNLDASILIAFPEGMLNQSGGADTQDMAMIMVFSGNFNDIISGDFSAGQTQTDFDCPSPTSMKIVKINKLKSFHLTLSCQSREMGMTMKLDAYAFAVGPDIVFVMYAASSESTFQAHFDVFQQTIQSLEVESPTDLSEFVHLAQMLAGKQIKQTVTVEGKQYDVNMASSSKISDFTLDESNKKISFKVEGKEGTAGNTAIEISPILQGPYVISMDGDVIDAGYMVLEDDTTNSTTIELEYSHSVHDITISGTNVVPEFPITSIALLGALVGIAAFFRSKFLQNRNRI
jgi:hypothetical protein